jgi:hypothetical protein
MKKLIIFISIIISLSAIGQNSKPADRLQVAGFIDGNTVKLRWAPDNSISWQRANKLGYSVYRTAVLRDGKIIDNRDSILLGTFKPLPLDIWESFADSSHFAVAAEAIYGKNFEVTTKSNSFIEMINKSREQESR